MANTVLSHIWNLEKQARRNREQIGGCQRQDGGMGEGCQKVQISHYNINKFWWCKEHHGDYN